MSDVNRVENGHNAHRVPPAERYILAVLKACHYAGGGLFIAVALMTAVHVVGRYGFSKPIPGLLELTSYFMAAAIFLQVAYVMMVKGHITIGIIIDRFSERTQTIIDRVTYILCLAFTIIALWQTLERAILLMNRGDSSGVLDIPIFPVTIIIGIGWGLFTVAIVVHLVHFFHNGVKR